MTRTVTGGPVLSHVSMVPNRLSLSASVNFQPSDASVLKGPGLNPTPELCPPVTDPDPGRIHVPMILAPAEGGSRTMSHRIPTTHIFNRA